MKAERKTKLGRRKRRWENTLSTVIVLWIYFTLLEVNEQFCNYYCRQSLISCVSYTVSNLKEIYFEGMDLIKRYQEIVQGQASANINDPSNSMKGYEFPDQLRSYGLVEKYAAHWKQFSF